jgi:hypothetical protein
MEEEETAETPNERKMKLEFMLCKNSGGVVNQ